MQEGFRISHWEHATDADLVKETLTSDPEAFGCIVERYHARLVKFLSHRIGSGDDAQELAQEVLLKAYVALESYNPSYKFSTWLYRIAVNQSIDFLRKQHAIYQELKIGDALDMRNPLRDVLREEKSRKIWEAIKSLPEEFSQILLLRHDLELSYEEIAQILDLPLGTAKNKLFRARKMLGMKLEGQV